MPSSHPSALREISRSGPRQRRSHLRRAPLVVVLAAAMLVALAAPASALLTGVDVSSHQHPGGAPINWPAVRNSGQSFAFIKATEGANYTNSYFASDWNAAGSAGLFRGAYHYARPAASPNSAIDQARYFVSRTGSMSGGADLPGVLDLEETGGLGPAALAEWTRAWLGEVQRLTGKSPIVYTGFYFWRDKVGNPTDIGANYRLWIASYPNDPNSTTFKPLVAAGWGTWTFWQHTSSGSVPGIPDSTIDLNRFCCDGQSLASLGGSGGGAGSPFGTIDVISSALGGVNVAGWAIDPDTTQPIPVHVYVGGTGTALTADQGRTDVGSAYTGFGDNHGFSATIAADSGPQQVCAYGINVGGGGNRLLGCQVVTVPSGSPIGSIDVANGVPGAIDVAGWSIDPNTAASNPVHVYVDGQGTALTADVSRPDVGDFFAGYGPAHGYSTRIPARPGSHQVCAYGIDVAPPGPNSLLGCRTVYVPDGSPYGALDAVQTAFGIVRVAGWTIDPDTAAPTDVHVYANGVGSAVRADQARPDVAAVFSGAGESHGFDAIVPRVGDGPNTVCAYAINAAGSGGNTLLGCRIV